MEYGINIDPEVRKDELVEIEIKHLETDSVDHVFVITKESYEHEKETLEKRLKNLKLEDEYGDTIEMDMAVHDLLNDLEINYLHYDLLG